MMNQRPTKTITQAYTTTIADNGYRIICNSTSPLPITLHSATGCYNYDLEIDNKGSGTVTVGGQTIAQYTHAHIGCDGTDWVVTIGGGGGSSSNGLPSGGAIGQIPVKNSVEDYDVVWGSPTQALLSQLSVVAQLPDSPSDGQTVILKNTSGVRIASYVAADSKWYTTPLKKYHADIADNFDRADNASSLGSADTGQSWSPLTTWGISSNKAYHIDKDWGIATIETGLNNFIINIDITFNNDGCGGIVFRTDGTNSNRWLFGLIGGTTKSMLLTKTIAGVATTMGSTTKSFTSGTVYNVKIVCNGDNVKIYLDGVLVFDVMDSGLKENTKHGFGGWHSTTGASLDRWDNFKVEAI